MDLATPIGFVGALGVITGAITLGGDPVIFLNGALGNPRAESTSMAVLSKMPHFDRKLDRVIGVLMV